MIGATAATVQINGKIYNVEDLLDKGVYTSKSTYVYSYPGSPTKLAYKAGAYVGKVYSWVTRADGIYLMFDVGNSAELKKLFPLGSYFIKASDLDERQLKSQGVKDQATTAKEAEKAQKAKEETTGDKIAKTATKIILGLGAIYALTNYAKARIK